MSDPSSERSASTSTATFQPRQSASKPRLLLVEDDPPTSSALRAILSHRGWEVIVATTLHESLKLLDPSFRCIVLDLMLPDGNGVDVLKEVRKKALSVKVIVTTGSSDAATLNEVRRLQPSATLQKPINLADLLLALPTEELPN